jgi:heat shock protein HslJ
MLLLFAACSPAPKADLAGGWKLLSYGDAANPTSALPGVDAILEFEKGHVSGNVGCNSFSGSYEMQGDSITFGPMMATEMYCEETSAQEQGVLGILASEAVMKVKLDRNILTLTSEDGSSVIQLERQ